MGNGTHRSRFYSKADRNIAQCIMSGASINLSLKPCLNFLLQLQGIELPDERSEFGSHTPPSSAVASSSKSMWFVMDSDLESLLGRLCTVT